MFDSICLHNPQPVGFAFDLGILAEAMVFYRHTRVLVNAAELVSLLRICGPDSLCVALESGFIELAYIENHLGVSTINAGHANERHGLVFVGSPAQNLDEFAYGKLLIWTNNRRKSRNLTDRLVRYVKPVRWEKPAAQDARDDLLYSDFCSACAKAAVRHLAPGYVPPDEAYYRVRLEAESAIEQPGFTMDLSIETDFDFGQANTFYQKAVPDAQFDKAAVLSGLFGGLADLKTAASFSDEMAVSPSALAIAELKLASLLSKRTQSDKKIEAFEEWTCEHGRAIREAVVAKRHNFDDILRLAEEAARFKGWLAKYPDSSDLNREYLKAVCNVGWAEKLPPKVVRFLLFTAVGGALSLATTPGGGLATGAALNALDYFLVDQLVKGWKPNQFVEGPLRKFVQ
jgi:hypothetical protein